MVDPGDRLWAQGLDLAIALGDQALIVLPALHRLTQRKQVFLGPGAAQRFAHTLGFALLDLHVAQGQQPLGAALAGDMACTTARPLMPVSDLITSCSLIFMRSSAFCSLFGVHLRYGLHTCQITHSDPLHRQVSAAWLPSGLLLLLLAIAIVTWLQSHPLKDHAFARRVEVRLTSF